MLSAEFAATCLLIATEVVIAVLSGAGLTTLGVGAGAWILGGIIAGAVVFYVYHSLNHDRAEPNRNFRKIGQVLIGLTVGFSIQRSDFTPLSLQAPIFLCLALFILGSGVVIGYIYSRIGKVDLTTAMLATTPGNIGVMASIAADYGKNTPLVSLVQLMRFTAVTFAIPALIEAITHTSSSYSIQTVIHSLVDQSLVKDPTYLLLLALVLGLASLAVRLGNKLNVPVAAFLCSILVGLTFNKILGWLPFLPGLNFGLPPVLNLLGQILLGLTIGEYWGVNPKLKKSTVAYALLPTALTFLMGFVAAGIAKQLTNWDWLTCLLVTSPGGSPEMIWIALTLNHNVEIVTAGHLIRLISINFSLPAIVALAAYLEKQLQAKTTPAVVERVE